MENVLLFFFCWHHDFVLKTEIFSNQINNLDTFQTIYIHSKKYFKLQLCQEIERKGKNKKLSKIMIPLQL